MNRRGNVKKTLIISSEKIQKINEFLDVELDKSKRKKPFIIHPSCFEIVEEDIVGYRYSSWGNYCPIVYPIIKQEKDVKMDKILVHFEKTVDRLIKGQDKVEDKNTLIDKLKVVLECQNVNA